MELSPKQQSVELIKKATRILILGHKKPDGDMIGTILAFGEALSAQGKTAEMIISSEIPSTYSFLPYLEKIKKDYQYIDGKLLRIDTQRIPVAGIKYQKHGDFLDIILDADKNLKYEHIEIINGVPKPDLIIVLDTPDVEGIDAAYDNNTELFYEVPVVNIDHHPGNEYFGTVNLVDLTASSTSEILVSLLEALGVKISTPEVSTLLLTGIISDTQSFRSNTTTPKSLTVAAQLLAAGARQQEIISNLYNKKPMALMKLWGKLVSSLKTEKDNRLAWAKVSLRELADTSIAITDVLESIDELIASNPDAKAVLILVEDRSGVVWGRIKGAKGESITNLAKATGALGNENEVTFKEEGKLDEVEPRTLKKIHDMWSEEGQDMAANVWDVIEADEGLTAPDTEAEIEATTDLTPPETKAERQSTEGPLTPPETEAEIESTSDLTPPETEVEREITEDPFKTKEKNRPTTKEEDDAIENALRSLSDNQTNVKGFTPLKEIMDKKLSETKKEKMPEDDIDVFDEEDS